MIKCKTFHQHEPSKSPGFAYHFHCMVPSPILIPRTPKRLLLGGVALCISGVEYLYSCGIRRRWAIWMVNRYGSLHVLSILIAVSNQLLNKQLIGLQYKCISRSRCCLFLHEPYTLWFHIFDILLENIQGHENIGICTGML